MEHPRPEQIELGTSVHCSLNQFQTVDLTLQLSIAPFIAQCVYYSPIIFTQPAGEADELLQLTASGRAQPLIKLILRQRGPWLCGKTVLTASVIDSVEGRTYSSRIEAGSANSAAVFMASLLYWSGRLSLFVAG